MDTNSKTLADYLSDTVAVIVAKYVGEKWVGRIEINLYEGGGQINILESHKFKKR